MKVSKSATRTVTFDPDPTPAQEADPTTLPDAPRKATIPLRSFSDCHDLLAWHEQACVVATTPSAAAQPEHDAPAARYRPRRPSSPSATACSPLTAPPPPSPGAASTRSATPPPASSTASTPRPCIIGYWNCYHEDELQAAGPTAKASYAPANGPPGP